MKKLYHLDLFSGIGGAALAIDRVWDNVEHIFCDNDIFCQNVLRKHWPNSQIYGDIKELTENSFEFGRVHGEQKEQTNIGDERDAGTGNGSGIYLLTGGFPCQPFSQAGRRKGTEDPRHLWPEMLRVIQEVSPKWIVGENVRGFVNWSDGLVFDQVQSDLETAGYEVISFILPAVAVNAPHRRDRVWIIAHRRGEESRGVSGVEGEKVSSARNNVKDTARSEWSKNWLEVATRLCVLDDGLSDRVVRLPDGTKISRSKWRQEALRGLGNAWVPAVAEQIFKAIKQYEKIQEAG